MADTRTIILNAIKDHEMDAMLFTETAAYSSHFLAESREEFDAAIRIYFSDYRLMYDAHMHIQSLNCTPLTLQWATSYFKTEDSIKVEVRDQGRKQLTDTTANPVVQLFTGDFGLIGRLSTDLIGKVFMCDARNEDFKRDLFWIINADPTRTTEAEAGSSAGLGNLSADRQRRYAQDFYRNCAYYFENHKVLSQYNVFPMDLSYAHYWGQFYLPINLPKPGANTFLFINDNIGLQTKQYMWFGTPTTEFDINDKAPYAVVAPGSPRKDHLFYDLDLGSQWRNFKKYIRLKTGVSSELPDPFYIYFDDTRHTADSVLARKDPTELWVDDQLATLETKYGNLMDRPYKHFVKDVPGDNSEIFEDYWRQLDGTIASAIRYPLQFFIFYHFDPRRHYPGDSQHLTGKIEQLKQRHAFFNYSITHKELDSPRSAEHPFRYKGDFLVTTPQLFDDSWFASLCTDFSNGPEQRAAGYLNSVSRVLEQIVTPEQAGIYWGIKMYPPLGYNPSDTNSYPHLTTFFASCAEKQIPITFHGSPLGMTLADPHNYLKDAGTFPTDSKHTFHELMLSAEEIYHTPANWRRVLETKVPNLSRLRICFAHFGSASTWSGNPDNLPDQREEILRIIDEFPNVYTDISCWSTLDIKTVAKNLVPFLNRSPQLKKRLLMGSDWYMFEAAGFWNRNQGVPSYYNQMFNLLKEVSKQVNYDAWHQFSVINPLRFLGFLDADAEPADTAPDTSKIDQFAGAYDNYANNRDFRDIMQLREDELKTARTTLNSVKDLLVNQIRIKASDQILNAQLQLRILEK